LARHSENGRQPLAQARGALLGRVVLLGTPSHTEAFENYSQARVTGAAIPDQIFWGGILLESVQVADFNVAA
jgi:hypothetical protein